jgi:hypothetical protein
LLSVCVISMPIHQCLVCVPVITVLIQERGLPFVSVICIPNSGEGPALCLRYYRACSGEGSARCQCH